MEAIAGAKKASMKTLHNPPRKEEVVARPMALPDSPLLDSGYPSFTVITAAIVPGMLTRMALIDPPYVEPQYIPRSNAKDASVFMVNVMGVKIATPMVAESPGMMPKTTPIIVPATSMSKTSGCSVLARPAV